MWVPLCISVSEKFCIEFATSLAILPIELNAELEDFAEQIDQVPSAELEGALWTIWLFWAAVLFWALSPKNKHPLKICNLFLSLCVFKGFETHHDVGSETA